MKKIIIILFLAFGFIQASNGQIQFGIKGGVNYNSNSVEGVSQDVFSGAESKTGYHAGIWTRIKIPVLGLYVRPELVYTNLENEVFYSQTASKTRHSFQKIDVLRFWDFQTYYSAEMIWDLSCISIPMEPESKVRVCKGRWNFH